MYMKPFATELGAVSWIEQNAVGPCSVLVTLPPKTFKGIWRKQILVSDALGKWYNGIL